jgi:hypothetical protein
MDRIFHNLIGFFPVDVSFVDIPCALGTHNRHVRMMIELPNEPIELIPFLRISDSRSYCFSIPRPAVFNLIMSADGHVSERGYKGTCTCDDL